MLNGSNLVPASNKLKMPFKSNQLDKIRKYFYVSIRMKARVDT